MSTGQARWTDAELERFLDEDLATDRRAELAAALREDGSLRARLAAIIEADTRIRAALLDAPATVAPLGVERRAARPVWRICAAAALVLVVGGLWWTLRPVAPAAPAPKLQATAHPQAEFNADVLAEARSRGLLFAVVPGGARHDRAVRPAIATNERVLALLDRGELGAALNLIRALPADSDAGPLWKAFGQRLSSGQAAQEVLMSLSSARQVEVCRAWAEEPALRPVAFVWLARLGASEDAAVREAVASLRTELEQRPELRAWLRSYASAAP